ncbi:MAG: hypothetical protein ACHQO8_05450 [Vicinamibacterales bacterium]
MRAEIARQSAARLGQLEARVEETVAQILAEADRDAGRRGAERDSHTRAQAARAASLVDRAADLWLRIVREGPPPRGSS